MTYLLSSSSSTYRRTVTDLRRDDPTDSGSRQLTTPKETQKVNRSNSFLQPGRSRKDLPNSSQDVESLPYLNLGTILNVEGRTRES